MEANLLRTGLSRIKLAAWEELMLHSNLLLCSGPSARHILKAHLSLHNNNEELHLEADQVP